ncbi:hypothetical protein M9H77_04934 [Catharanthus roseus]|uniref:Uncharacterized protein n=1 Tax=Catharanthus roseus TaxID=4058 RepID=A0ACC0CFI2_CATRO|nr:hypothetical protein M9H77_04934 [Catharanthus roseus]
MYKCIRMVLCTGIPTFKENDYVILWRVNPLERGRNNVEGLAQSVLCHTLHHALRYWSQDGPSRCPRICSLVLCDLRVRWLWNRVLVRCLAGTYYGMSELVSDDLVMGSGLYPWSATFA